MLQTVRVLFSKTGRARFISHLDLMRTMTRVMRRAQIPLWYTEGFNRHPYLTFAAPLPLGQEGLHETMDLRLEAEMPMPELVERLNAAMPAEMRAISAGPAIAKPGDLASACYQVDFRCPRKTVAELLGQPEIPVEKRTKKKTVKTVDIRQFFSEAYLEDIPEGVRMCVTLPCGQENVNPVLFCRALYEKMGEECACHVVRTELLDKAGMPFR